MLKMLKKESHANEKEQFLNLQGVQNLQWREIKTPSTVVNRRSRHSSCIYKDKLYIYGGYDNSSPEIFRDLICFSFLDNNWETILQKGNCPGPRHSHSVVVYKDQMYLFGGMYDHMENTNKLTVFYFQSHTWSEVNTKNLPQKIDSHNCCLYRNQMIVAQGYSKQEHQSAIYSLDLDSLVWKTLFDPNKSKITHPEARSQSTCCIYNDKLVIYGGKDSHTIFNDLWFFDLQGLTFEKWDLQSDISGRYGHCASIDDSKLYIFGGTRGVTHQRNDLVVIDMETKEAKICWMDSQEQKMKKNDDSNCSFIKKSRRDSAKKGLNWFLGGEENQDENSMSQKSPGKYRTQLKEVGYYNSLYQRQQNDTFGKKKIRKNPLLKEINSTQGQGIDHMSMTATFEILTSSILFTQSKSTNKEDKHEFTHQFWRKIPKARDNSSSDLLKRGNSSQMIIFGGGMHKIGFNDILIVDLKTIYKNYVSQEKEI